MNNELIKRIDYCLKYDELPTVARQTFQLCLAALSEQAEPVASSQPTELEMHRADYNAIKAAGFDSPGELLAAYNTLTASKERAE